MRQTIDSLICSINDDLASKDSDIFEVALFFRSIGVDRYSRAVSKRNVLLSYVDDDQLSQDARDYAKQMLDSLPVF